MPEALARLGTLIFIHATIKEGFMEKLSFYDVKTKGKFETTEYKVQEKSGRFFAVAKSLKGTHECWRVLGKDQAAKLKKG